MYRVYIKYTSSFHLLFILIFLWLTRIPQWVSPYLFLDGDEAILGLMAKHFIEYGELSLYFWGQQYGFSAIETSCIALFYWIRGIDAWSVKFAMLSLWSIGIVFFYLTIEDWLKERKIVALLIILLFICAPFWGIWSMKARGGYVTAFVLLSIILYILRDPTKHLRSFQIGLLSFFCVLCFHAQPLFLIGILPLLLFVFSRKSNLMGSLIFLGTAIGFQLLLITYQSQQPNFWMPGTFSLNAFSFRRLLDLPNFLYVAATSHYFYSMIIHPDFATRWVGIGLVSLIPIVCGFAIFTVIRKKDVLVLILLMAICFTIGYLFFLSEWAHRYILPLWIWLFILTARMMGIWRLHKRITIIIILLLLVIFLLPSVYGLRHYRSNWMPIVHSEEKDIQSVINILLSRNVSHVFCLDPLLQWQLMFYSNENLICRYISSTDRRMSYVQNVNNIHTSDINKTAVVGYNVGPDYRLDISRQEQINKYYFILHPTKEELKIMGFEF